MDRYFRSVGRGTVVKSSQVTVCGLFDVCSFKESENEA